MSGIVVGAESINGTGEVMWPGRHRYWYLHADGRPPCYINAPWWYVHGAELWAEELSRKAWLDEVRQRLGLVTITGTL